MRETQREQEKTIRSSPNLKAFRVLTSIAPPSLISRQMQTYEAGRKTAEQFMQKILLHSVLRASLNIAITIRVCFVQATSRYVVTPVQY